MGRWAGKEKNDKPQDLWNEYFSNYENERGKFTLFAKTPPFTTFITTTQLKLFPSCKIRSFCEAQS